MAPQDENLSKAVTGAIAKGAAELAPAIYEDGLRPAVKQVGIALETVSRAINLALSPLRGLVWGGERCETFIRTRVAEKLREVPPDQIITPDASVAGPAIERLRFAGDKADLREMFANLLATAMDSKTASTAHPAFAEIISQLTPDEARMLEVIGKSKQFPAIQVFAQLKGGTTWFLRLGHFTLLSDLARCQAPSLTPTYLDNLARLRLIEIVFDSQLGDDRAYEPLEHDHRVAEISKRIAEDEPDREPVFQRGIIRITSLGRQFYSACIESRETKGPTTREASEG